MIGHRTALIVLAIGLVSVAASQVLVKARFAVLLPPAGERSWAGLVALILGDIPMWIAGGLVILGAVAWYAAMTRLPLSLMLPAAGIVAPLVSLAAYLLLGETMTVAKVAAIALIAVGVIWLGVQHA